MAKKDEKFYWLKLKRDFFKRHDIKIIESLPNGKDYLLVYLKLLCESIDHDGNLRFSDTIPYDEKMLSTITNTNVDVVKSAMQIFIQLKMIEVLDDETIYMNEIEEMIGSSTYWAERKRIQRNTTPLEKIEQKECENMKALDNVQQMSNSSISNSFSLSLSKSSNIENDSNYNTNTNNINNNSNNNKVNTNSNKVSNNTYASMEEDPIISINKVEEWFAQIWKIYPNKKNKKQAKETYGKKILNLDKQKAFDVNVDVWKLLIGSKKDNIKGEIRQWKEDNTEMKYIPHFSSWLNANIEDSDRKNSKKYKSKFYKIENGDKK